MSAAAASRQAVQGRRRGGPDGAWVPVQQPTGSHRPHVTSAVGSLACSPPCPKGLAFPASHRPTSGTDQPVPVAPCLSTTQPARSRGVTDTRSPPGGALALRMGAGLPCRPEATFLATGARQDESHSGAGMVLLGDQAAECVPMTTPRRGAFVPRTGERGPAGRGLAEAPRGPAKPDWDKAAATAAPELQRRALRDGAAHQGWPVRATSAWIRSPRPGVHSAPACGPGRVHLVTPSASTPAAAVCAGPAPGGRPPSAECRLPRAPRGRAPGGPSRHRPGGGATSGCGPPGAPSPRPPVRPVPRPAR